MIGAERNVNSHVIAERLAIVRERIAAACRRVGRDPQSVTLIAVSKTFPIEAIEAAYEVGLTDFGENKVQELTAKAGRIPGQCTGGSIRWHMIGHLQRNKARRVVENADLFHTLDSLRLAQTLDHFAAETKRVLPCLVQVNISGEASKSGCEPDEAHALIGKLRTFDHLRIEGLMTIAGTLPDSDAIRTQFRQLHTLLQTYNTIHHPNHPLRFLSMGMSVDFELAIEEGATHVRVGSAIFGTRG